MFNRKCPKCGIDLFYTNKGNMFFAEKKKTVCASCSHKNKGVGSDNPMYGRSLYSVWVKKYGKEEAGEKLIEYGNNRKGKKLNTTPEGLEAKSHKGLNNPMYGKTFYEVWVDKYGVEEADLRMKNKLDKMSKKMSGSNNPMFGKPSPVGSGNGWSGWFKGHYFRSLLELSYLKYLIDNDIKFESGEKKEHSIVYYDSYKNVERNYFPDFYLIDTQEVIELKPKKLLESQQNKNKYISAKEKLGDKFIIITEEQISKLSDDIIKELYDNKDIIFLDRYDKKFKERFYDKGNRD